MTLREALDLLELNERTLEQSMLESSLQNRLEHTELRHVLRVFEAYRKVNAFLNPSFNTQGDARMTIIDESVPGGPMLEVTKASAPMAMTASVATAKERDTFSDSMIETWAASAAALPESKTTLSLEAVAPRAAGVSLFMMLGLIAAAFSVGMVVFGPTLSLIFKRPAPGISSSVPSSSVPSSSAPSISSPPPVVTAPPVITAPPVATVVTPSPSVTRPVPPVAVEPVAPAAPIKPVVAAKPVAPAITKPAVRPTVTAQPPVVQVKPRVTPQPRVATPRVAPQPRVTVRSRVAPQPRVTVQPRVASRRTASTPRASSRPVSVVAPPRRAVNERQFARWDSAGAVLRYRSWRLVPDAVRSLPADAFRAAIFVARDPSSLPDIQP